MSELDAVKKLLDPTPAGAHVDVPNRRRGDHPRGWEPGIRYDAGRPSVFTAPPVEDVVATPDEVAALVDRLGGPALPAGWMWTLAEASYNEAAWSRSSTDQELATTRPTWRYKFKAMRVEDVPGAVEPVDLEPLLKAARSRKPVRQIGVPEDRSLVVALADWQIGQGDRDEHEGALEGQVRRVSAIPGQVRAEVARLKRAGTPVGRVVLAGLGDLVEGCGNGWYAHGMATQTLDRREQVKVVRRLLLDIVMQTASLGLPVTVIAVGGNHGENRPVGGGKAATGPGDNDDVAVFEMVHDALACAGRFDHVSWHLPQDKLVATIELHGQVLAITHGHLFGQGAGSVAKATAWLKGQALARQPAGDCDVLLAGHLHHLVHVDIAERGFLQAPAMCSTSAHFAQSYGLVSRDGLLTFTLSAAGEDDVKVHTAAPAEALAATA